MPIPDFDETTGYLPGGAHPATLEEVGDRLATGLRRRDIFDGLVIIVSRLRDCGVTDIWLDGSFVTNKLRPGDVDVVYDNSTPGVDNVKLEKLRLRAADRKYNKATFRVDLWVMPSHQRKRGQVVTIKDFFESDDAGTPKGVLKLLPPSDPRKDSADAKE